MYWSEKRFSEETAMIRKRRAASRYSDFESIEPIVVDTREYLNSPPNPCKEDEHDFEYVGRSYECYEEGMFELEMYRCKRCGLEFKEL